MNTHHSPQQTANTGYRFKVYGLMLLESIEQGVKHYLAVELTMFRSTINERVRLVVASLLRL